METKEQLTLLSEIGRLDLKIIVNREKLNRLSKETALSEAAAQELSALMIKLTDAKNDLLKRRRTLDEKLQAEKGNIRKWEARAEKIKGEREYTALMSEIGAQKRTIVGIETEISEVTDELKTSDEKLKTSNSAREEKMASAQRAHDAVKELLSEEEQHLTKNKDARENLLDRIPKVLRLRYERIYEKRALQGVAFLRDSICQACMRTVPPELFNRVCKGEIVEQCPACQRLLVVDGEIPAAS
jgi:uncharacterized protein